MGCPAPVNTFITQPYSEDPGNIDCDIVEEEVERL